MSFTDADRQAASAGKSQGCLESQVRFVIAVLRGSSTRLGWPAVSFERLFLSAACRNAAVR
jgi:hypothetical protein